MDASGELIGVYAGVVETARRGTYLAVAGGPLIDFADKDLVSKVFSDLKKQGKAHRCDFVRVRPQEPMSENILKVLSSQGCRPAPMYLSVEYAGVLDLGQSEEEILKGASQGFRRKLRKAYKNEIEVTADDSDKTIAEFCKLEKKHAERQKYVAFSGDFLTKQFEAFREGFALGARLIMEVCCEPKEAQNGWSKRSQNQRDR